MKYLITTTQGLKEEIKLNETPQIETTIQFNDSFYRVKDIIYFADYTEIKTIKRDLNPKPITIKWS